MSSAISRRINRAISRVISRASSRLILGGGNGQTPRKDLSRKSPDPRRLIIGGVRRKSGQGNKQGYRQNPSQSTPGMSMEWPRRNLAGPSPAY